MRSHVNHEQAARLRSARAEEDAALTAVNISKAAVERIRARRAAALARYDIQIAQAEAELGETIAALVTTAGIDRAALALGLSRNALRRMLPRAKPPTTVRMQSTDPRPGGAS